MTPLASPFSPLTHIALFNAGPLLEAGFYLIMIIFAIFSAILMYHWQSYSSSKIVTTQTYIAYALLSTPLIITLATIAFTHA
jgi:prolipoprotein diacylglyceryltransferase